MQTDADTQTAIDLLHDLDEFEFSYKTITSNHIHIALIELAVTSFLRTVGTPDGLDLESFEGKTDLLAVLHHVAGKRNRKVVTQPLLGSQRSFLTAILDAEEQLVALFAVLAHQGR